MRLKVLSTMLGLSDTVYQVVIEAENSLGNEGTVVIVKLTVQSPLSTLPSLPAPSGAFLD